MALDVFISYSHKDRPLRDELEAHLSNLQRQGHISAWYDGDIVPGTDWQTAILAQLNKAHIILLLISADFMASDFCYSIEMQQAIARHQANQARVIPIILRPTDWEGAPFAHLKALPTDGRPVIEWPNHDSAFLDVMKGLRAAIKELSPINKPSDTTSRSGPLSPGAEQVQVWTVLFQRNPFFTGRSETLTRLHDFLQLQQKAFISQPAAISGLGGIGKTQTAIEYAYRYAHEYRYIFWVQSDTRDTLTGDYVTIARLLDLPEQDAQDQNIIVEATRRWLSQHTGWLLIYDNADNLALLDDFVPPLPRGHLLITTRTHLTGGRAARVEMEKMSEEEGTRLLLTRIGMLAADTDITTVPVPLLGLATTLVKEMDGLPLALDQAGAYIEETGCGLPRYLELYRTQRQTLLARRSKQPSNHPEPVATTWSLSFKQIEQTSPGAAELLRCCAFLHPDAIPEELFVKGAEYFSPVLQQTVSDLVQFDEAISDLLNYSLLRRLPDTGDLSIHRLVQAVLKDGMDEDARREWEECILRVVDRLFPFGEAAPWPISQRYLPHAMLCAESIEHWWLFSLETGYLLNSMASYLSARAQYREAEPLYQHALATYERMRGSEHPETAMILNNLAVLYWNQGRYEQAEQLYQRALAIKEQVLGPEHPETASTLNNLGLLYVDQEKYEQAEQLYQRALTVYEQVLGPKHPHTAGTLDNLAGLYVDQEKYEQAELFRQRALAVYEQVLGPEHPETASTLNNLAVLYWRQGKYEQAEQLYQRALAIYERVLGPEHPHTASPLNNLAVLYYNQGKYERAKPLYQRALAIREQMLGLEHPDTAATRNNLAELRRVMSEGERAEDKLQDTGREHQDEKSETE